MFTSAVRGAQPVVPPLLGRPDRFAVDSLDCYLVAALTFGRDLARATSADGHGAADSLDEFSRLYGGSALDGLREHSGTRRSWQHGDLAPGNVLLSRSGAQLIDWEHASPAHYPWHDAAYLALVLSLIAAYQTGSSVSVAFDALYREDSWGGKLVRERIAEYWDSAAPIGKAITITAVDVAIRRPRNPAWSDLARHLLSQDTSWLNS
jgi:hypothetical protein